MTWSSFKMRISIHSAFRWTLQYILYVSEVYMFSTEYIKDKQPTLRKLKLFSWVCCFPGSNLDIFYFNIFNKKHQYQHLRRGKEFSCPKSAWEIVVLVSLIQWPKHRLCGIQNLNSSSNNKSLFMMLLELCNKFNKLDNFFIKIRDTLLDCVIHPQQRDYKQWPVSYFKLGLVAARHHSLVSENKSLSSLNLSEFFLVSMGSWFFLETLIVRYIIDFIIIPLFSKYRDIQPYTEP